MMSLGSEKYTYVAFHIHGMCLSRLYIAVNHYDYLAHIMVIQYRF